MWTNILGSCYWNLDRKDWLKDNFSDDDFHGKSENLDFWWFSIEVWYFDKDHFARGESSRFEVSRKLDFDSKLYLFWINDCWVGVPPQQ